MLANFFRQVTRTIATTILTKKTARLVKQTRISNSILKTFYFQAIARINSKDQNPLEDVEYAVYYGEDRAVSHYNIWNPVFSQRPGRYVSIFRNSVSWWEVCENPDIYPVSVMSQIEQLFARMPNLKAVFYPANNGVNIHAVRNNHLTHVFLGHGDSDKASSANKVFRLYDQVWVAGQAHRDRFRRIAGDYSSIEFRTVGQPWMRDWLNALPSYPMSDRTQWAYFPTWQGYYRNTNYSSLGLARDIIDAAQNCTGDGAVGFLKPHPWSKHSDLKTALRTVDHHEITQVPALTANGSDQSAAVYLVDKTSQLRHILARPLRFVICDVSAAVTECLYVDVPIFLYNPEPCRAQHDEFAPQNEFCYIYRSAAELRDLLDSVISQGNDTLAEKRKEALAYYVDVEKTRSSTFFTHLDELPPAKLDA